MGWNAGKPSRREALGLAAIAGFAALLAPRLSFADQQMVDAELKKLYGDKKFENGKIKLDVPEIAENGLVVPISVEVDSPMTEADYVPTTSITPTRLVVRKSTASPTQRGAK